MREYVRVGGWDAEFKGEDAAGAEAVSMGAVKWEALERWEARVRELVGERGLKMTVPGAFS